MKKLFLLLVMAGSIPLQTIAQDDDLYFVSGKTEKRVDMKAADEMPAYYRGTNRSADEYNRAGRFRSYYQKIGVDSLGNDIITFRNGVGVSPDTTYIDTAYVYPGSARFEDDYVYTRSMSRWDDFYDPWFYSYGPWRTAWHRGWYDPWYYGYGGFYDPWYSGWYAGWYDPWYYGYGGWYGPYYRGWYSYPYGRWFGGGYVHVRGGNPRGYTGDRTWTYGSNSSAAGGARLGRSTVMNGRGNTSTYTSRSSRNRSFGERTGSVRSNSTYNSDNSGFGSSTRSIPSYNSGSFGGSRSSGGSIGGGGSFGGSFGSGRSVGGGGGHFGVGRR